MPDSALTFLESRRKNTNARFLQIQKRLEGASQFLGDFATAYASGSFGRGEASEHSDLDVFLLSDVDNEQHLRLTPLQTIQIQAALIDGVAAEGLPPFTDGGKYLKPHSLRDMIEKLGGSEDDYENLFTARILLLLESRPLAGNVMYQRAVDTILDEYWKDEHHSDFLPIYLTNDIIRYWKVLCLNYEHNARLSKDPNKQRLSNYKLKNSRILTCYSAILYLCHRLTTQTSISKADARAMIALSPVERLTTVSGESDGSVQELIGSLLHSYVDFLKATDAPKAALLERFSDDAYYDERRRSAMELGGKVFDLLEKIGRPTKLFRYLVV
jgi:predicted nucleotidyltransferase